MMNVLFPPWCIYTQHLLKSITMHLHTGFFSRLNSLSAAWLHQTASADSTGRTRARVWSYGFLIYFIVPHGLRSTQKALMPCIGAGAINHTLSWRGATIRHLAGDLDIEPWTPETPSSSPVWSGWERERERDWRGENILMRGYDICSPPHILQEALSEFMGIKKRKCVCQNVLKINSKSGLIYCIITLLLHLNPPLDLPIQSKCAKHRVIIINWN